MRKINLLGFTLFSVVIIVLFVKASLVNLRPEKKPVDVWQGIDRNKVAGQTIDSCRCTIISGKLYKVNPQVKTYFIYSK